MPFWLCVGDVADASGGYEPLGAPIYWIKGNNDNFDAIAAADLPDGLHYLPNATAIDLSGVRVAGLGGTFAPRWYDTPAADLPHPRKSTARATELADKRRHFVREEVEACRRLHGIDVFLTHEAPHPFKVRGIEAGKTPVNEVLSAITPRLHLFGHHHRFAEQERHGVRSVCLDLVSKSYLLVDARTWDYAQLES